MLKKKQKKKRLIAKPTFWIISLLLGAGLWFGGRFLLGMNEVPPRLDHILLTLNGEPQKVLSGEILAVHPTDRIKILHISTSVPFNLGVRLVSKGFDVGALRYDEFRIGELMSDEDIFSQHRFRISVKQFNRDLGYMEWKVQPHIEDWLDKIDRTINKERKLGLIRKALELVPDDPRLIRRLLETSKALGQWTQASTILEAMAKAHPSKETLFELLDVYTTMGDKKGVAGVLKRLLETDPEDRALRIQLAELLDKQGQLKPAIGEYEALLKRLEKGERLPVYKRLGYLYTETGQFKEAIGAYRKASELDTRDANLYYNLSFLYEKTGQQAASAAFLEKALNLKADDTEGRLTLAQQLLEKGDLEKAERYLDEVLQRSPDTMRALLLLMRLSEKKGDKTRLKQIYSRILSLDPKNETVIYNLGALEYEAGNLDAALSYFSKYVQKKSRDIEVHELLFDIYKRKGDTARAFKEAIVLVGLKPKAIEIYPFIFEYLRSREDYKQMIPIFKNGLRAVPDAVDLHEYLVLAYLKTGDDSAAIEHMKALAKQRPSDLNLLLNLARLLEKREEYEQAADVYGRIIEISPGHEEAEEAYLRLRLKGVKREQAQ